MKTITTIFLAVLQTFSMYAQYCTAVGPTSTIDSNVESVQLTGVLGNINFIGCPGVMGLQDLTSLSTTLNAGGNYTLTVEFGTCGGVYAGAGTVWIDYDQSLSFDPIEAVGTWTGSPNGTLSVFNFTVPAGAQNGFTRMRIMQAEQAALPLNPCATFSWGSVMDFGITIGNGIDCTGYVGDEISDPIIVSALPFSETNDNSYCYANQNLVYNSPDIYYRVNPSPLMQSISVSLCGSSFDTFLSVVDAMGNIIAFNDDADGCGTSSALEFDTEGLGVVYVIVEGWGTNVGEYEININANYLSLEEMENQSLQIYPNPTDDLFYLGEYSGDLQLIDLLGKEVLRLNVQKGQPIDVSALQSGIYLLKTDFSSSEISGKINVK